jgi:alpha-L-rhamnosidase
VLAPWKLYQYYDDTRVLEEGYPAMKAYVDYLSSTAKDKVISWGLGDWLDESAGGGGRRVPVAQTSTAAYFLYSRILSQVAALLDRTDDSLHYANQAEAIRAAFNERFLDPGSGLYAKDSQTAQALPLALGLAPEDRRSLILEQLVQSISGSRKNHVSAGIVGVLYLFHALMENGRDDLAWAMLSQEDYPGWLPMLNQGATSIWEAWNGEASLNHPTFGCVGFWFYQGLGGIRPATVAPGFKRMLIKPALVGDLEWVKCAYASVHGKIESHWRRDKDTLLLEITIPANTRATVYIPTTQPNAVTESGVPADQAPGVKLLRSEAVAVVYEIGSGTYCFKAPASSL